MTEKYSSDISNDDSTNLCQVRVYCGSELIYYYAGLLGFASATSRCRRVIARHKKYLPSDICQWWDSGMVEPTEPDAGWVPKSGMLIERISTRVCVRLKDHITSEWTSETPLGFTAEPISDTHLVYYRPRYLRVGDIVTDPQRRFTHITNHPIQTIGSHGLTADNWCVSASCTIHIEGLGPVPWPPTQDQDTQQDKGNNITDKEYTINVALEQNYSNGSSLFSIVARYDADLIYEERISAESFDEALKLGEHMVGRHKNGSISFLGKEVCKVVKV